MANIKIQDVDQRIQYTATSGQTEFTVPFPFFENSDLVVYQNSTLLTITTEYTVTGAGSASGGLVTLVSGATLSDIITIQGQSPIDRTSIYSATISNLTGSDLNNDFNRDVVFSKQLETTQELLQLQYKPYAEVSQDKSVTLDRWLPVLGANQGWAKNSANTAIEVYSLPVGGAAPADATYLVQTADADLPNAQAMGALASGIVVNTTTTGTQLTRTLTGTTNEIDVTNGTGISGNPTLSIATNPTLPGTGYFYPPKGTTAQRPVSPADGMVRYNTTLSALEVYEATTWDPLSGGVVDSVTGTTNEIDVDNTDTANPVLSLSAAINAPGTFTIQSTVALDSIIDDDTMATATDTNISTSESIKAYIDGLVPVAMPSPGTDGTIIRANTGAWVSSTATFADTYGDSTLLYANGPNTVEGLSTANSAMLYTTAAGVPVWSTSMTNGQIMIGTTSGSPTPATITPGTGISVANAGGQITISATGGGFGVATISGTSQAAAVNTMYIALNAGQTTLTLPSTFSVGDTISMVGSSANSGGWVVTASTGDTIMYLGTATSAGGTLTSSANAGQSIELVCDVADTSWVVVDASAITITTA